MNEKDVPLTWEEFKDFILWAECTTEGREKMAENKRRNEEAVLALGES